MTIVQKTEVKIADFGTFVADFGGYLGLFLGASILSITDILGSCAKRLVQRIFRKSVVVQGLQNQDAIISENKQSI